MANDDDKKLWRWNFSGKGFSDSCESAVGCKSFMIRDFYPTVTGEFKAEERMVDIVCTSIVDVAALKTSEFVFLISEYAGKCSFRLAAVQPKYTDTGSQAMMRARS